MIETHFTPLQSLGGGLLIGLGTLLLWVSLGKVAGISGVIKQLPSSLNSKAIWRFYFVAGLIGGGWLVTSYLPNQTAVAFELSPVVAVLAGALVGLGTGVGNGCTSGHGICGLARFSKRSFVATLIFMSVGIVTTYLTRHVL